MRIWVKRTKKEKSMGQKQQEAKEPCARSEKIKGGDRNMAREREADSQGAMETDDTGTNTV